MKEQSKFLSYLLRHKPEAKNLTISKEGWVKLDELITKAGFTLKELLEIVDTDEKGRYALSDDKSSIRAVQGHSTDKVNMHFTKAVPPVILYHGTSLDIMHTILKQGIKPMSRHYVHLSADLDVAENVAGRRKRDVTVFRIDTAAMLKDGIDFFKAENGVWLVDYVDPKYIITLGERK
jgi:putative RNA 2'-phosphotransferase